MRASILLTVILGLSPLGLAAAELVWHPSLEKGIEEARQASRPIFLVAMWKDTV